MTKMIELFNLETYYRFLKTARIGRPCIYLNSVSSTIDVAPKEPPGTLILAREQTHGRGQRDNKWESLIGCAMGSMRLECAKDSLLAKRVCFTQHILALSIARTLEEIDPVLLGSDCIGLKWPNDLLLKKKMLKIGGILVNTSDSGDLYNMTLSFGLNVDNRQPTTCINEIIGRQLGVDQITAEIMNKLEHYIEDELDEERFQVVKEDYKTRCIQIGKVVLDEKKGTVKVTGVDSDGFLTGVCETSNKPCTITKII